MPEQLFHFQPMRATRLNTIFADYKFNATYPCMYVAQGIYNTLPVFLYIELFSFYVLVRPVRNKGCFLFSKFVLTRKFISVPDRFWMTDFGHNLT